MGQGDEARDTRHVQLKDVARKLELDPEVLEAAWEAWREEMDESGWTEKQMDEARYWLDVMVIGDLAQLSPVDQFSSGDGATDSINARVR